MGPVNPPGASRSDSDQERDTHARVLRSNSGKIISTTSKSSSDPAREADMDTNVKGSAPLPSIPEEEPSTPITSSSGTESKLHDPKDSAPTPEEEPSAAQNKPCPPTNSRESTSERSRNVISKQVSLTHVKEGQYTFTDIGVAASQVGGAKPDANPSTSRGLGKKPRPGAASKTNRGSQVDGLKFSY